MAQSNNPVKFAYIAVGSSLPVSRDADTIYFDANDQQLYVGSDLIANASALDVVITGAGDYVSDAVFSDGTLTLTKSTLPDVTGAMRFIGASSTEITDQGTELPTIGGETVTPVSGDVVIYNSLEFVWDGAKWIQLGDESSYALKTIQVTAGAGLSGGGTLSSNITLEHQPISIATPDTTYNFEFTESGPITDFDVITKIDVDEFGHLIRVVGSNVSNVLNSGIDAKVTSAISGLASKSYVDSALSGLASEGYVDDAISSLSSKFISQIDTSAVSDVKSTVGYVTSMVVDSGPTIAYTYASVGEVTSTDTHLVTGQAVYSAIESAIESAISELPNNVTTEPSDSEPVQYLVGGLLSDGMVDLMYRNFGTVTSTSPDAVTGSTVYSALQSITSEFATQSYVDDALDGIPTDFGIVIDGGAEPAPGSYLHYIDASRNPLTVETYFRPFGSVAYDDTDPVTGSTVYSYVSAALVSYVGWHQLADLTSHGDYLTSISVGPSTHIIETTFGSFASTVTSTSNSPVTGSTVYSAISGLASKGYVDEAISSAIPDLHISVDGGGDPDEGQYLYAVADGSDLLTLDVTFHPFGSIASDNNDLVTGGIVYSAISQFVSAQDIASKTVSAGNGLTGGGALSSNLTLSHYTPASATNTYNFNLNGSGIEQFEVTSAIAVDDFGHIVSVNKTDVRNKINYAISMATQGLASEGYVDDAIAGLSGAMKFIGISTTEITDGGTQRPTISGETVTPSAGDVVIYDGLEFVWTGTAWAKFGDESSYALKTVSVIARDGLSGGGNLTSDLTISHYTPTTKTKDYGESAPLALINTISVDAFGHITSASYRNIASDLDARISSATSELVSSGYLTSVLSNYLAKGGEIVAGDGLSGGGELGESGTVISHYIPTTKAEDYGTSGAFAYIKSISVDAFGHIISASGHSMTEDLDAKISSAISNLASVGYVDDTISSATSEFVRMAEVDTTLGSDYIYSIIYNGSDYLAPAIIGKGKSFGSVTSTSNSPVTGSTVYSAISGFASTGYVDTAISSATNSLLTGQVGSADTSHSPTGAAVYTAISYTTGALYDVIVSDSGPLNSMFATRAYVSNAISSLVEDILSDSGPLDNKFVFKSDLSEYITQSTLGNYLVDYAAISYVDDTFLSEIVATGGAASYDFNTYITNVSASDNQILYDYTYAGSVAPDDNHLITGATVYGYVESALSGYYSAADLVTTWDSTHEGPVDVRTVMQNTASYITGVNILDGGTGSNLSEHYLYDLTPGSNIQAFGGKYRTFGSVASDSIDPVTGSTVYSALQAAVPTWTVI